MQASNHILKIQLKIQSSVVAEDISAPGALLRRRLGEPA
jgi:hypothetical protein